MSTYLFRQARATDSPALEGDAAHLRADAWTSLGVLGALIIVEVTGIQELDAATALVVAGAIVWAGIKSSAAPRACSWTRCCRLRSSTPVRAAINEFGPAEVAGFHKLRARARRQPPLRGPARAVRERHRPGARARAGTRCRRRSRSACAARTC